MKMIKNHQYRCENCPFFEKENDHKILKDLVKRLKKPLSELQRSINEDIKEIKRIYGKLTDLKEAMIASHPCGKIRGGLQDAFNNILNEISVKLKMNTYCAEWEKDIEKAVMRTFFQIERIVGMREIFINACSPVSDYAQLKVPFGDNDLKQMRQRFERKGTDTVLS